MSEENKARKIILDSMMSMVHRDYGQGVPQLLQALDADPYFVVRALVHAFKTSKIRDQQDMAVIALLQSDPKYGIRSVGKALLGLDIYKTRNTEGMTPIPPYRLFRIFKYVTSSKIKVRRLMRTFYGDYLNYMERNPKRFEQVILKNRKAVKELYVWLHRKPVEPFNSIVFLDNPPEGSIFWQVKQIAKETDPIKKAEMVVEYKIPYTIASSLLPKNNAAAHMALIANMTPQEAANTIAAVEESGVLEVEEVKDVFLNKVSQAKATASMVNRKSSKAKTDDVKAAITKAADKSVEKKIQKRVLLDVDISGSMDKAIEVALNFTSHIAASVINSDDFMMVFCNETARHIKPKSLELSELKKATSLIKASGRTSLGVGLQYALKHGFEPDVIVKVTDGGENCLPKYSDVVNGLDVQTVIIGVNGYDNKFHKSLPNTDVVIYNPKGSDYYLFDQVANLLTGERGKTLIETILEIELPEIM